MMRKLDTPDNEKIKQDFEIDDAERVRILTAGDTQDRIIAALEVCEGEIRASHTAIAGLIYASRESVCRTLKQMREAGLVKYERRLVQLVAPARAAVAS